MQALQFVFVAALLQQNPPGFCQKSAEVFIWLGAVSQDIAINASQIVFELLLFFLSSPHLPGMGIATAHDQSPFPQRLITLPEGNLPLFGRFDQQNSGIMVQPRIRWKVNVFFLDGRIDI